MTDVVDTLLAARDKVAAGWCQGTLAKDSAGNHVYPQHGFAAQWCARGAVYAVIDVPLQADVPAITACTDGAFDCLNKVAYERTYAGTEYEHRWDEFGHGLSAMTYNDQPGRTQAEVVDLFDDAIRLAKSGV